MNDREFAVFRRIANALERIADQPELEARNADLHGALERLVELKDGPRDAAYEIAKPRAWHRARAVLRGKP